MYSIQKEGEKFRQELDVLNLEKGENEQTTVYAKRIKQKTKHRAQDKLPKQWEEKALHGKYPKRTKEADVDQNKTNQWLRSTGLKAETEGLIIAAQDQSLATRSYHATIIKDGTQPTCRICNSYEETIDHTVSGCPELAKTEYIQRHNKAAAYIHWKTCQHYNIQVSDKCYEHEPPMVTENKEATILWDIQIHTDREITANKPDIVIKDHKNKTCTLIDMAVPSDRNTSLKTTEKLSKYKDLEIETTRMWGMKTETISVVIGALGLIKTGLQKHAEKIPGAINFNELQKVTLLGTAHILSIRFCLKSKIYQPFCALVPWFGPGPSGVYSRLIEQQEFT